MITDADIAKAIQIHCSNSMYLTVSFNQEQCDYLWQHAKISVHPHVLIDGNAMCELMVKRMTYEALQNFPVEKPA